MAFCAASTGTISDAGRGRRIVMAILLAAVRERHRSIAASSTAIAFLVGAACSALSGYIGMFIAVAGEHPHRRRRPAQPQGGADRRPARRRRLRLPGRRPGLLGVSAYLFVGSIGGSARIRSRDALPDRRLRLRRLLRRPLRPARRRYLHQGRRRRRRPRRQGRGRHPGGRPAQRRRSSPTSSATTSATAPAVAPTSSSRPSAENIGAMILGVALYAGDRQQRRRLDLLPAGPARVRAHRLDGRHPGRPATGDGRATR